MEIAAVENDENPHPTSYKHDWIQILYMITSAICFLIEVYQRISLDLFYASYTYTNIHVPALNRYPTEFTASYKSISYIWYLVFVWQTLWMIYSFIGIFRRTPSGSYFYEKPCAMNKMAFFHTTLALVFYIQQLLSAADNTYYGLISFFHYTSTFYVVILIFVIVQSTLNENMRSYFRDRYLLDVWLARILYQNGIAIWAAILFYEACLSIIIALIYTYEMSSVTACSIGSCIFLIGIIVLYAYETLTHKDHSVFILSHWFVFCWLLLDINYISRIENKLSTSLYSVTLAPLIYYIVLFFMFWRLMLLCLYFRQNGLPTFRSRKVYNLIDPPPTVF